MEFLCLDRDCQARQVRHTAHTHGRKPIGNKFEQKNFSLSCQNRLKGRNQTFVIILFLIMFNVITLWTSNAFDHTNRMVIVVNSTLASLQRLITVITIHSCDYIK